MATPVTMHLHGRRKDSLRSTNSQLKTVEQLIGYCEKCLWGAEIKCQHKKKKCVGKELMQIVRGINGPIISSSKTSILETVSPRSGVSDLQGSVVPETSNQI